MTDVGSYGPALDRIWHDLVSSGPGEGAGGGGELVVALYVASEARLDTSEGAVRIVQETEEGVELELPMPVRRVAAHPAVDAARDRRALQRGPLTPSRESTTAARSPTWRCLRRR